MTSQAIARKDEVIERLLKGDSLNEIAKDLGYAGHAGVLNRLHNDPEYQAASQIGLRAKMDRREKELEAAPDNVSVTRAERLLGHARWLAERLHPERFGQLQKVQVEHLGDLGERLRRSRERVIDAVPQDIPQIEESKT